ncbi:hypothetical protein ARMGADRAFT_1089567 [Armillaria gallica]|uniref:Uncharacterized protein n=1 Tax=Armillaria gallica TaxID=47427 RepID=A0A2H3CMY7_ARMGA|nr:hypothetical protein ARMGADRAFT_1089567 [Armillaria gallica]
MRDKESVDIHLMGRFYDYDFFRPQPKANESKNADLRSASFRYRGIRCRKKLFDYTFLHAGNVSKKDSQWIKMAPVRLVCPCVECWYKNVVISEKIRASFRVLVEVSSYDAGSLFSGTRWWMRCGNTSLRGCVRSNMNMRSLFGSQSYSGTATSLSTKNRDVTTAPSTTANQKASGTGGNVLGGIYQALVSR